MGEFLSKISATELECVKFQMPGRYLNKHGKNMARPTNLEFKVDIQAADVNLESSARRLCLEP